ncbi:MAG TPA: extracellular solute-binding protein [Tepidisphaeraceae bacterium]|jgi:multiple sugar transport system permease protein|nr:extracellular solute-binding protein [Tepidisphaeraceae bacterium]
MTIGKAVRWLLAWGATLVVIWSFFEVGLRLWREHDPRDHRTPLVILQWGDASEEQIVRDLVAQYEREHPDIKILRIHAADYDSKLKTMLAAGTAPDLFYLSYEYVPEFAKLKLLANLDPFIAGLPDGKQWLDGFYPLLLDAFRYDGHEAGRGPLYGIPKDFTTMVMYVNCDLFKKAGIPLPYNGWTWDEFEKDCKKISALPPDAAGRDYGAVLNTSWPLVLQNILQCYGGDFFKGADFSNVTLDSPQAIAAMTMVHRLRFIDDVAYHATGPAERDNGYQLFFTGKVGCLGPLGRWETPHFRGTGPGDPGITDFQWDVVPLPHETRTVSDIAVVAWTMSSSTKHPKEAFQLLRFLCGKQGQEMMARLGLAIPSLKAVAKSDAFLSGKPEHAQVFLDSIKHAEISQIPAEREFTQYFDDEISKCLTENQISPTEAAKNLKARWLREEASPLKTGKFPPMNWQIVGIVCALAIAAAIALAWYFSRRQKLGSIDRKMERIGWLCISPWFIGFLALTLGPMVMSLLLSMTRWTAMTPVSGAQFVGLDNYRHMMGGAFKSYSYDDDFGPSLRVTAYYALLAVPLTQIAALAVALLMNTRVKGIGIFRTIYYIPTLVGGVTMAAIWLWLFNKDYGLIDHMLAPFGHLFHFTPPDWVGDDAARWGVPAFTIMALWTVGGGMLIYLAALKNVPASLYEAAHIDGASRIGQFVNVTIPMISPLIFFNLIMAIIASFQIFAQVYVMTDGGPGNATLVYVLYLYRQAFEFHNMGYASALAWVLFILVLALTVIVIRSSRRWVYYEGLKA